jgi:hypothetical protein
MSDTQTEENISKSPNPLVFISHDTRDGELAEAFSNLLKSVSAGVLKSFRNSDRKGSQGIEYGVEWYPENKRGQIPIVVYALILMPLHMGMRKRVRPVGTRVKTVIRGWSPGQTG